MSDKFSLNHELISKFPDLKEEISELEKGIYCILVHEYMRGYSTGRLGRSVIYPQNKIGTIVDSARVYNQNDTYGIRYWTELIEID